MNGGNTRLVPWRWALLGFMALLAAWLVLVGLRGNLVRAGWQDDSGIQPVQPAVLHPGDALPEPRNSAVLTVHVPTAEGGERVLRFDLEHLEQLGTVRFRSKNRWYPEAVTYEGVLGADFLDFVHPPASLKRMKMRALNDYVVHIPVADFRMWPVLLATRLNGERMPVREKGPLWVVYPNHLEPALGGPMFEDKWIWQLTEIWFEP